MARFIRVTFFIILIATPIFFYKSVNRNNHVTTNNNSFIDLTEVVPLKIKNTQVRGQIAIIFDDLGGSLEELRQLYKLNIPLTISVIPDLKFSRNIAHIGARCGFSVFIHLPLAPEDRSKIESAKYRFISSDLSKREVEAILRRYLNYIRIAIGVNNHMGSEATQDRRLMEIVMKAVKNKGLIFVDSKTSANSVAYEVANSSGLVCGYNEGFLDSLDDTAFMEERIEELILKAQSKGKIIVIAHPKKSTVDFLRNNLPRIEEKVDFITVKDYFDL